MWLFKKKALALFVCGFYERKLAVMAQVVMLFSKSDGRWVEKVERDVIVVCSENVYRGKSEVWVIECVMFSHSVQCVSR